MPLTVAHGILIFAESNNPPPFSSNEYAEWSWFEETGPAIEWPNCKHKQKSRREAQQSFFFQNELPSFGQVFYSLLACSLLPGTRWPSCQRMPSKIMDFWRLAGADWVQYNAKPDLLVHLIQTVAHPCWGPRQGMVDCQPVDWCPCNGTNHPVNSSDARCNSSTLSSTLPWIILSRQVFPKQSS